MSDNSSFYSIYKYVGKFFKSNEKFLLESYPGISEKKILDELEALSHSFGAENVYFHHSSGVIKDYLESLSCGVPLEYIRGRAYFYKSEFHVDNTVLIPRFETEILVERAVKFLMSLNDQSDIRVLDMGTGCGAVGLSIAAEFGPLSIYMSDISRESLKVAKRNYYNLNFSINRKTKCSFLHMDRLEGFEKTLDLLVSNPPYIMMKDRSQVHHTVDSFEPKQALYLEDHRYFEWFETYFSQAEKVLREDGVFMMEGHERRLDQLAESLAKYLFKNINIGQDYTGRKRFLFARRA